ncbi:MAG: ABC1 kinase family protein [Rhizobiaceae bacterium]
MDHRRGRRQSSPVPSSPLGRFAGLGMMAAGIAGRGILQGAAQLGRGQLPDPSELLLTPTNILRFTDELARMRGPAMKLGQLISMDAGDFLPPELALLMARLRSDADHMPLSQLQAVLTSTWGANWRSNFQQFDLQPMAAASIGQVHRAQLRDGRELAVKIQYPGVARSIDSDVEGMVKLLGLSGLGPSKPRLSELASQAKEQLREEANYLIEASHIRKFTSLIGQSQLFNLPAVQDDLTTATVLAMSYVPGRPIEEAARFDQDRRNKIVTRLLRLSLKEVFDFGLVQTDPNFANFRYDDDSGRVGLVDFGATQPIDLDAVERFRQLLRAGLNADRGALEVAALDVGLFTQQTNSSHASLIISMIETLFRTVLKDDLFDFGKDGVVLSLQQRGMDLATDPSFTHVPPFDVLYLQRKFAGMYLLARRLRAQLPLRQLLEEFSCVGSGRKR